MEVRHGNPEEANRFLGIAARQVDRLNAIIEDLLLLSRLEEDGEKFVCFDISLRMPGSPGTRFTPYSGYLFREPVSFGPD